MEKGSTYYEVLGVTRRATEKEIKEAYRALAWSQHPDRVVGGMDDPKVSSDFAEFTAAYATLSDPKERRKYDAKLMLLFVPCPSCKGEGRVGKQKGFANKTYTPCADCAGSGIKKYDKGIIAV